MTDPTKCPRCGEETFTQHTPEEGPRGPFHVSTFAKACPPKPRTRR